MSPPINLDGSTVDAITMDGDSVSEVTVDGSAVFSAIPDSGISRWTYDDADLTNGVPDDVWGSNDATNNGATTGVTGQFNEAFEFDNDDTVTADVVGFAAPDSFSLPIWINTGSTSNFEDVFNAQGAGGAASDEFAIQQTDSNTTRLLSYVGGSLDVNIESSATIDDNSWHLLTPVWDGPNSQATYYLDDAFEIGTDTIDGSSTDFITSTGWTWGARVDGTLDYVGRADDPRVYDKALSSTEVSNLYNTGSISG